jgi:hypothetical protein
LPGADCRTARLWQTATLDREVPWLRNRLHPIRKPAVKARCSEMLSV